MRAEHHRPGFGRAVSVGHRRLRQRLVQRRHQAGAHRRRAHAHEFDAGEVGARHQFVLAQHHGNHRRYRGEPGAAIAADRLDIGARGKLRQQHDGGVRRAGELGERQRVHVIERRRDQITVAVEAGRQPRLHHPDMALVRQHDALRRAGRAGGVEKHRRLGRPRRDRFERSGIEESVERRAELHAGDVARAIRSARRVAEHEFCVGVAQDEMNRIAREFEIGRHGDETRAHDAVIGGEIFGAVGGEDGDAVAALEAALAERPRHAVCHGIELREAELARARFAAEVDERGFRRIAIARDQIAEIVECRHCAVTRSLAAP